MPNEPTKTPDVPVLETASCLACGSKRIAYKVREDAQIAINSHYQDKRAIIILYETVQEALRLALIEKEDATRAGIKGMRMAAIELQIKNYQDVIAEVRKSL